MLDTARSAVVLAIKTRLAGGLALVRVCSEPAGIGQSWRHRRRSHITTCKRRSAVQAVWQLSGGARGGTVAQTPQRRSVSLPAHVH